jgi:GNAT superfamily N-acetyltransferase
MIAFGGEGVEDRLANIINAAYQAGEAGLWEPGWKRTSREGVERLVAAGEIAVAWQDGEPVGCVRIRRLEDGAGMFGMLSVDPVAHGTGLGKALIAFAEATYPDAHEMELELLIPRGAPHPSKVRLHEWYTRLGYVQVGRRDFAEPGLVAPADLWVYRKNLRAAPATEAPDRAPT